jgi:hypothetical protein
MKEIRKHLGGLAIIVGLIASLNFVYAQMWLEPTGVSNGQAFLNLHNATNLVYEIWSKTDLLAPSWNIEQAVWPETGQDPTPFAISVLNRTNLFIWARDWTGIDENSNSIPDWWEWHYFGNFNLSSNADYDGDGNTILYDYQNGIDPNIISFSIAVTNNYIDTSCPTVPLNITGGVPSYLSVLVNDYNLSDASWQPYTSSNVVVLLNSSDGNYDVWIGLRGLPSDGQQTWQYVNFIQNTTPLTIVITNPLAGTISQPSIQLQGYASKPLSSLTFDVTNSSGLITNQQGYLTGQFFDINLFIFTTNYFQCPDVVLGDGLNTITFHATDRAGNTTNISFTLEYSANTNAPVLTVIWPQDGTYISDSRFTLQGQVDDATAKITASIVDASGNTNTVQGLVERSGLVWIHNLPLATGANTLTVTAMDAAGNASTMSLTLYQSSVLVTMNALTSDQLNQSSVTVFGTVSDATTQVYVNGVQASVNEDGTWEADNVLVSPAGTAIFDVEVYGGNSPNVVARAQTGLTLRANDLPSGTATGSEQFPQVQPPMVVTASYSEALHYRDTSGYVNQHYVANWVYNVGGNWVYCGHDVFNEWPFTVDDFSRSGSFSKDGTIRFSGAEAIENSFGPPWSYASYSGGVYWGAIYDNSTEAKVMIVPSGQQTTVGTNLYLVRACASEFSDPASANIFSPNVIQGGSSGNNGDVPLPPEWFQIKGQTLVNSGITNTDGSVWGETIISAPAGKNVDITPTATQVYENWDYTFTNQVFEVHLQLAVDANRDGNITFDTAGQVNPDQTTADKPYRFWVNNDHDGYDHSIGDYDDLDPATGTDAQSFSITCTRDLEDYTRLWINTQGITEELQSGTFLLALEWKDAVDDPQMQFFQAAESDGGTLYLTDTNVAQQQFSNYGTRIIEWRHLNTLTKYNPFIFPTNFWSNISADQPVAHFLIDAVNRGSGKLVISIYKNDGVTKLAEGPPLYLDLKDVKEMYVRWTVGESGAPATTASLVTSPYSYDSTIPAENNYILFVHGWNLAPWERDAFAETAFKRLYWQGYKGHFGAFQWPTGYGFGSWKTVATDPDNFDNSEFNAWNSAIGLKNLLASLNDSYPNHVYLFAHSMGNVVAGEALKLAGSSQVVNTYIAMQGAIAAHCYDQIADFRTIPLLYDSGTPDRYANYPTNNGPCYFSGIAGAGSFINFFNPNDWALEADHWQLDQDLKPDLSYSCDGANFFAGSYLLTLPFNTYQIFAYCDEARCYALGAQANVGGVFDGNQTDLSSAPYNFGSEHKDHSGEFNSDNMNRVSFWNEVLVKLKLKQP